MKHSKLITTLLLVALMPFAFSNLVLASEQSSITGKVYCDKDKNGACDCEEDGLAGLRIKIYEEHCGGAALHVVSTDNQGNFIFQGVEPGTYFIMVDLDYVCGGRVPTTTNCREIALTPGESLNLPAFGFSEYGQ